MGNVAAAFKCAALWLLALCAVACSATTPSGPIPSEMTWEAWLCLATIIAVILVLFFELAPVTAVMFSSTLFLMVCGVINSADFISGLSTTSIISIAHLFIVVDPLSRLKVARKMVDLALSGASDGTFGLVWPRLKLCLLAMGLSMFANQNPVVVLLTPMVKAYCRENGLSPKQFLMPMAFASALGGSFTLVGTSVNLTYNGLMQNAGMGGMTFFALIRTTAIPSLLVLPYLCIAPSYILSSGGGMFRLMRERSSEFLAQFVVRESSPLVGRTVAEIDTLMPSSMKQNTTVIELVRANGQTVLAPPRPSDVVQAGDLIAFTGPVPALKNCATVLHLLWVPSTADNLSNSLNGRQGLIPFPTVLREVEDARHEAVDEPVGDGVESDTPEAEAQEAQRRHQPCARTTATLSPRGTDGSSTKNSPAGASETAAAANESPTRYTAAMRRVVSKSALNMSFAVAPTAVTEPIPESVTSDIGRLPQLMAVSANASLTLPQQRYRRPSPTTIVSPLITAGVENLSFGSIGAGASPSHHRAVPPEFIEVVLSYRCPALGQSVGSGVFQRRYGVSILALRKCHGSMDFTPQTKLQQCSMQIGDTLLLFGPTTLVDEFEGDFSLVSYANHAQDDELKKQLADNFLIVPPWFPFGQFIADSAGLVSGDVIVSHDDVAGRPTSATTVAVARPFASVPPSQPGSIRAIRIPGWYRYIAIVIFLVMIGFTIGGYDIFTTSAIAVVAVVSLKVLSLRDALAAIDLNVMLSIVYSFGLGIAITKSGLAGTIGKGIANSSLDHFRLLIVIAAIATVVTNAVTNKACAQVLFPVVISIYRAANVDPLPAVLLLCAVSSWAFCTPYGKPTNLIILGPGGYAARDYARLGIPLNLFLIIAIAISTASVYGLW